MYGCESWTIKKDEHWRIDTFELCCWRRLLRVPWTAMRSNQSILKEISPEYSLEGLMLKLKLQNFGHLMWLIWKDPGAGKDWRREGKGKTEGGWDGWLASPTQWTCVWVNSGSRWCTGRPVCRSAWGHKELDTTERLNWTEQILIVVEHSIAWLYQNLFIPSIVDVCLRNFYFLATMNSVALKILVNVCE